MSAIPQEFLDRAAELSSGSTKPLDGSKKIYVEGSRSDIQVPMREIHLEDTASSFGAEKNPPIPVYDTSGPYTDPKVKIDLLKGLADVRSNWIEERDDTEKLAGPSSDFGQQRQSDPALADLRFEHIRTPRRAKNGKNVSQMHYARKGIITPEMEYIAIRESMKLQQLRKDPEYKKLNKPKKVKKIIKKIVKEEEKEINNIIEEEKINEVKVEKEKDNKKVENK